MALSAAMPALKVVEYVRSEDGIWSIPRPLVNALASNFHDVAFVSPPDRAAAEQELEDADVVIGWAVRRDNFERAQRLRWIHLTSAGLGPLLFPELVASPVVITNSRGLHADAMAEHALGVMLAFARKLHLARDAQNQRRWAQDSIWFDAPPLGQLAGATLGLIGFGAIGRATAVRAKALGMRVIAVRRRPSGDPAPADAVWSVERLAELLTASDFVVVCTPLTAETRGMIGADSLAHLRPHAILVNLGRGALVDEPALIAALQAGRLAGAGLDVFAEEPLPADSVLWELPQVIVTPHVSGFGPRLWERALDLFAHNLRAWLDGRPLDNVVDKQAGY
jgi:phosphoglycerate dehydrogenase-like enzyme